MSVDLFSFSNDLDTGRITAVATNGAALREKKFPATAPRLLAGLVMGFVRVWGVRPAVQMGDTAASSEMTEFIVQSIIDGGGQLEKFRVVVVEAASPIKITTLSGSILATVAEGEYCDILCDSNGIRSQVLSPQIFSETSPPAGSQTLYDDAATATTEAGITAS